MNRPLLLAGLTILILGGATAAHAHGDSRGARDRGGRGCEARSHYGSSWERGRGGRYGGYDRGRRNDGHSRYGSARRGDYRDRTDPWNRWDRERGDEDYRDREHARADHRYEREWEDRDDRLEREIAPVRPNYGNPQPGSGTPNSTRRSPNAGGTRRPAS